LATSATTQLGNAFEIGITADWNFRVFSQRKAILGNKVGVFVLKY
jgi:hypothetical protein